MIIANGGVPVNQDADGVVSVPVDQVNPTFNANDVMLGKIADSYIVEKFGRNSDVDTGTLPEDIWNGGGLYTGFPTAAAEQFEVLSSSVNDTALGTGARILRVFYFNDNYEWLDANGNFLFVDVTLNGVTPVLSGVTGMRVWRAKVISSGSLRRSAGAITVRWVTSGTIFAVIPATFSQTQIAAFTIPAGFTGYLKTYGAAMFDKTANNAEMSIRTTEFGTNTDVLIRPFSITDTVGYDAEIFGGVKLEEKTDISMRAVDVTASNGIITGYFSVLLVKNA